MKRTPDFISPLSPSYPQTALYVSRKIRYTRLIGTYPRCWRCGRRMDPGLWDARLCSTACARQRSWGIRRGRACLACGSSLDPLARADTRFCSTKCRQRVFRRLLIDKREALAHEAIDDDRRELKEAWNRARRADPLHYPATPFADVLRAEGQRLSAVFYGRHFRACEDCEKEVEMRSGQKYCSTRCRVAAHRRAAASRGRTWRQ